MHYARLTVDRRINGKCPDGHPCHMLLPIPFNADGVNVEIIQCSLLSSNAGYSLIKIIDTKGQYEEVLSNTEQLSSLMGECSIMKVNKNQYMATVMNNSCMLAEIVSQSGVFLVSAKPVTDDIIEWAVIAPNNIYVNNLIRRMESSGYAVKKKYSSKMSMTGTLTAKQDAVIKYALEHGYYDIPRKIDIDGLCQYFGGSKSTMSVILRSAEKKLISLYANVNLDPKR